MLSIIASALLTASRQEPDGQMSRNARYEDYQRDPCFGAIVPRIGRERPRDLR